ncbi:MAG: hypothetical protein LBE14_06485 [Treponema sp.]|jgi:hypothetical protein|nr:hypothetical protein [Treponema sp.]
MNNTRLPACAGVILAYSLCFAGCPQPDNNSGSFDPRLAGTWSNRVRDINQKTFVIEPSGSFTASINPGMGGRGIVTGKLVTDNDKYVMTGMVETAGTDWQNAVGSFNHTAVQVVFSNDDTFELKCARNELVETFFGGLFYRESPGTVFDYRGDTTATGNAGGDKNNTGGDTTATGNTGGDKNNTGNGGESAPVYSLVGSWSNGEKEKAEKTFTIAEDGVSFTVSVDPGTLGGRGTVTGKLVAHGDGYKMEGMRETTNKGWGGGVALFNGTVVQIEFSDKDTFKLECAKNKLVAGFFGGKFYRISQN